MLCVSRAKNRGYLDFVACNALLQPTQEAKSCVRGKEQHPATVLGICPTLDQRLGNHSVDQLGQGRRIHPKLLRHPAHGAALLVREKSQHAPVVWRDTSGTEAALEPFGERTARPLKQQRDRDIVSHLPSPSSRILSNASLSFPWKRSSAIGLDNARQQAYTVTGLFVQERNGAGAPSTARQRHPGAKGDAQNDFVVGLLVPINGSAGLWGPSAIACAQLAQAEINEAGGLLDRELRLHVVDASDECTDVGQVTAGLMRSGCIDALVGMHTSQVRQRVLANLELHVPYVYTPLYEGGEKHPGVFAIGETPEHQLRPALRRMLERFGARRWFFVGNDYVWPRVSNRFAAQYLRELHGELLGARYLPFGTADFASVLTEIERLRPHAVLMSLVGQDAVQFNRDFGASGLASHVLRLSAAIEENGLLAIGAEHTEGLFASSGYFASLDTERNMAFRERYHNSFRDRAPTLNALGQSTYEGIHFLASLIHRAVSDDAPLIGRLPEPLAFRSVRGTCFAGNDSCTAPVYLAEAEGHLFRPPVALHC